MISKDVVEMSTSDDALIKTNPEVSLDGNIVTTTAIITTTSNGEKIIREIT